MFTAIIHSTGIAATTYGYGHTDPNIVLGALCGNNGKTMTMYRMMDYSGAVDAWLHDFTMVPGPFAVYRLSDIQRQEDWYLCRQLQFLGYRQGDLELSARARL